MGLASSHRPRRGATQASEPSFFPPDFTWGAQLVGFQWEGAAFEDGKGAPDWDIFAHKTGTHSTSPATAITGTRRASRS
jgi:beta-glucosidase/6-phospho-beta-glucosidase/beta-galactosidase